MFAFHHPPPVTPPCAEMTVMRYCVCQFAVTPRGAFIRIVIVVAVDATAPVHCVNRYLVPVAPGCGLVTVTVAVAPSSYQPPPVVPPRAEFTVRKYCVCQFAVIDFGASMVSVTDVKAEVASPVHEVKRYWVPGGPVCGLVTVAVAMVPRAYHPAPVVPPNAEFTVRYTSVLKFTEIVVFA